MKPTPVGLFYANIVNWQSGTSLLVMINTKSVDIIMACLVEINVTHKILPHKVFQQESFHSKVDF